MSSAKLAPLNPDLLQPRQSTVRRCTSQIVTDTPKMNRRRQTVCAIGRINEEQVSPLEHKPSLFMYDVKPPKEPRTIVVEPPNEEKQSHTEKIAPKTDYCIHASKRASYDLLQRILIVTTLVVEPLRFSFGTGQNYLDILTFLMDLAFVTDMPVNALTTELTQERVEITNCRTLVKNYVCSYNGLLSLLLMIPIVTTGCVGGACFWVGCTLRSLRVLRWWVRSRGSRQCATLLSPSKFRIVMLVASFGIYCHVLCCWMYAMWVTNVGFTNAAMYAPLYANGNQTTSTQYAGCFSTVLLYLKTGCPTNGYGGIRERLFEIVCNFSALLCLGTLIGELSLVMQHIRADSLMYERKKNKLSRFLERREIPMTLRKDAYAFYEHQHRLQNDSDKEILHTLPSSQVYKIRSYMLQNMFERVQILQDADPHLLRTVMIKCRNEFFFKGDVIYHEGDIDDSLYFLMRGEIEMWNVHDEIVTTLGTGSHFGDLQLFGVNGRCATTAIAARYCDTCVLERNDLLELLERFPEEKQIMNRIAKNRMRQMQKGAPYRDRHVVEKVLIQTAVQKHGGEHAPKHLMSNTHVSIIENSYANQRRPAFVLSSENNFN